MIDWNSWNGIDQSPSGGSRKEGGRGRSASREEEAEQEHRAVSAKGRAGMASWLSEELGGYLF